jgi:hypothetical protein
MIMITIIIEITSQMKYAFYLNIILFYFIFLLIHDFTYSRYLTDFYLINLL